MGSCIALHNLASQVKAFQKWRYLAFSSFFVLSRPAFSSFHFIFWFCRLGLFCALLLWPHPFLSQSLLGWHGRSHLFGLLYRVVLSACSSSYNKAKKKDFISRPLRSFKHFHSIHYPSASTSFTLVWFRLLSCGSLRFTLRYRCTLFISGFTWLFSCICSTSFLHSFHYFRPLSVSAPSAYSSAFTQPATQA